MVKHSCVECWFVNLRHITALKLHKYILKREITQRQSLGAAGDRSGREQEKTTSNVDVMRDKCKEDDQLGQTVLMMQLPWGLRTDHWYSWSVFICNLGANCYWVGLKRECMETKWTHWICSLSLLMMFALKLSREWSGHEKNSVERETVMQAERSESCLSEW